MKGLSGTTKNFSSMYWGVVNNLLIKRTVAKHLNTYYCTPRVMATFNGTLRQAINNRGPRCHMDEAQSLKRHTRELT